MGKKADSIPRGNGKKVTFALPIKPFSINAAFQGRRFKTKDCKLFEQDLWVLLPHEKTTGMVAMKIDFFLVNYFRTDISNLVKIMEDILVKKGIIEDDRKVQTLHLSKFRATVDCINVEIIEL